VTEKLKITRVLDIRGEVCPYTYVKSKLALEELTDGNVLEIVVDYKPAVVNVPRSLENEGHNVIEVTQINETVWKIVVKKKGG
jgi:TusA-related sulfurtransferase